MKNLPITSYIVVKDQSHGREVKKNLAGKFAAGDAALDRQER